MPSHHLEVLGSLFFLIAILHTFCCGTFKKISAKMKSRPALSFCFHIFAELELVFVIWALPWSVVYILESGLTGFLKYLSQLSFHEPIFIFIILLVTSSSVVLQTVRRMMMWIAKIFHRVIGGARVLSEIYAILFVGPLLGSLVSEPAAMTVSALLLLSMKKPNVNTGSSGSLVRLGVENRADFERLSYFLLGLLFVNVSIGGTLTHYAAPPILMVAQKWNWDLIFVFTHLGWKSMLAVFINSSLFVFYFRNDLEKFFSPLSLVSTAGAAGLPSSGAASKISIIKCAENFWRTLRFKEATLVAIFLAGLVVFGPMQRWWVEPIVQNLSSHMLYFSAAILTAFTDNAALTYLGAQIPNLSETSKYYLVAGAVAGGGLTVIANAPNPAGYAILQSWYKNFNPIKLFLSALVPTIVALLVLI